MRKKSKRKATKNLMIEEKKDLPMYVNFSYLDSLGFPPKLDI